MNAFKSLAALALLAFATIAFAADPPLPQGVARVTSVEGITEYRLANGLRVLFAPDDSKPTTTVNTTYLVGSRLESYGETGMAHLLEHLMFKGTPTYPMVWDDFRKRGLRANGSTWTDRTNYFASWAASDENLEWYLKWSADAMTHSFIARKDLDSEMTVVRNELELGENNPFRSLHQRTQAAAYTWHSYGKSTIGARADVENVSIEHLQAFYRKYYQPDNAVLIVTGKFDPAKTLTTIAATFGKIPKPTRVLEPTYTVERPQEGERTVTVRRVGDTQIAIAAYHVSAGGDPDYAAIELVETILGDTPTGRLHKALVEPRLAAQVFGFSFSFKEPTLVFFGAQLPNDASLDKARDTLVATVESVAKDPITAAELDRARTKYLKNFDLTAADPEKVGVALSEAIGMGDWRLFFLQRDRVRAAKLEDVQRVAAAYLVADNRTLGIFVPTSQPHRAPEPKLVDVGPMVKDYRGDAPVAQGEAFEVTPANIESRTQRVKLANGMRLALVPKKTRGSTVSAVIVLRFGDERSLFAQLPAGGLTGSMLNRGAGGMTRQQIQDAFDKLKAQVSFGGGPTGARVSLETVRDNLPAVLKLVATVLRRPDFPAAELDSLKNERATQLEAQRKEPQAVASVAVSRHGNPYPKGDIRYARDFDEAIADTRGVSLDQVRAFYTNFYGADHGEMAVVGDFDAEAVKALAAELLGDWKSPRPYTRVPTPVYPIPPTEVKLETPDKANAFFAARLMFALRDDDPDYPAILIANYATGGGPGAILWKRIREKEGVSYDVRSILNVSPYEKSATWLGSAIYAPQNLARVQQGFREEIAATRANGFTPEQLADAKKGLLLQRRLARAQDGALAGTLALELELDRTMDFDARTDRAIEVLTLEQVNAALRKYVDPSQLVIVYAGDFAKAK
jgi:zinc protease